MSKKGWIVIAFIIVLAAGWGIGRYAGDGGEEAAPTPPPTEAGAASPSGGESTPEPTPEATPSPTPDVSPDGGASTPEATASPEPAHSQETPPAGGDDIRTVAEPDSIAVLVNKQYKLPDKYKADDLVYPDVPFIFKEKIEKRMMRKEAAEALKDMFDGAKADGIYLAGVSAYRSESTQSVLFNNYVERDGEEKARTYSAVPGHSEHQTGLAIDVSGSDGKCAATGCFGGTPEAVWIAGHAHEYGFIVRYPEGKQSITGYMYEPWHIRYVGKEVASEIASRDITLEEYLDAVPVSR